MLFDFNNIANNARNSKNLFEKDFLVNQIFSNNLFLFLFLAQFYIFLYCYICKYWLQNS